MKQHGIPDQAQPVTEEPVPPPRRCACGQVSHHTDGWCGSNCTFSSSPPKTVPQMLHNALALLNREFPAAKLVEVRLEFRSGERHGERYGLASNWTNEPIWTLQVNNDRESHSVLSEALAVLRAKLARKAQVPGLADRVAALLREIPNEGFERNDVLMAAQALLEKERSGR